MSKLKCAVILMLVLSAGDSDSASTTQSAKSAERTRVINSDRKVPIAKRLLPQDEVVIIEQDASPPLVALNRFASLEGALDQAMEYNAIAVIRNINRGGVLINGGTWIRGTVTASVVEVVKASPELPSDSKLLKYWHTNGELFVNHVLVRAGRYPMYVPNEDHLLFLGYEPGRGLYPGRSFRITRDGLLEPLAWSSGETMNRTTPIYGQSAQVILKELRQRVSK